MENFSGVEVRAAWDGFKFWLKHSLVVERIAIVGNRAWQEWAAKIGAHFLYAEARYFDASEKEAAWQWL